MIQFKIYNGYNSSNNIKIRNTSFWLIISSAMQQFIQAHLLRFEQISYTIKDLSCLVALHSIPFRIQISHWIRFFKITKNNVFFRFFMKSISISKNLTYGFFKACKTWKKNYLVFILHLISIRTYLLPCMEMKKLNHICNYWRHFNAKTKKFDSNVCCTLYMGFTGRLKYLN